VNLGKWVLRNLFIGFILEELERHQKQGDNSSSGLEGLENDPSKSLPPAPGPQTKSSSSSGTLICSPGMICAVAPDVKALVGSSTLFTPLIPLRTQSANINVLIPQSANSIPTHYLPFRSGTIDTSTPALDLASPMIGKDDYFTRTRKHSIPGGTPASPEDLSIGSAPSKAEPSTPNTPGGLMGKLRNFGRGKRPPSDTPNIPAAPTVETPSLSQVSYDISVRTPFKKFPSQSPAAVKVQETAIQKVLSGKLHPAESNDAPTSLLPTNTAILISEEGTPSHSIIYRGLVSDCHKQVKPLEEAMPLWLVEYLLLNQTPTMATPPKMSFVLVPWNKDPGIERLPELLNT
jgi:WD repeat-containing protein 48